MNSLNAVVFSLIISVLSYHVQAQSNRYCPSNMIQMMNGVACSTDAMCQGMSIGFFCYQGYCCSNSNQVQSGYGSSCTYSSQCIYPNMQCTNNVCYCLPGYDYNGNTCSLPSGSPLALAGGYYSSCLEDCDCTFGAAKCIRFKCQCSTDFVFDGVDCVRDPDLSSSLTCPPGQLFINGYCQRPKGKGEYCRLDDECRLEERLRCIDGQCQDLRQIDTPLPLLPEPQPLLPYPEIEPPNTFVRSAKVTICCLESGTYPCCITCCLPFTFSWFSPVPPAQSDRNPRVFAIRVPPPNQA